MYLSKNKTLIEELVIKFTDPLFFTRPQDVDTEVVNKLLQVNKPEIVECIYQVNVDVPFLTNYVNSHPEDLPLKNLLEWSVSENQKVVRTVQLLNQLSRKYKLEFLVFKSFPLYIAFKDDIDIYVNDLNTYNRFKELLQIEGFRLTHAFDQECHLDKEGHAQVDMHTHISWDFIGRGGSGPILIDKNLLWKRKEILSWQHQEFLTPSVEDELLLVCAHALFQHRYVTLGEILHIGEFLRLKEVNLSYMFEVAKINQWEGSLQYILALVKGVYKLHWGIDLPVLEDISAEEVTRSVIIWPRMSKINKVERSKYCRGKYCLKFIIRSLIYFYRYWHHYRYYGSLAFNPVPRVKLSSILKR
jgi:hypothetical protein